MIKSILLCLIISQCQAWNDTDLTENRTETVAKPFVYYGRYQHRGRRQSEDFGGGLDTASTVLSILPLDRIGAIVGQIMATGIKEMMNPDVGKKLVNVLENQAPLLLTSLFSNLYSTLSVPVRPSSSSNTTISVVSMNNNTIKQLSNSSSAGILSAIRQPTVK